MRPVGVAVVGCGNVSEVYLANCRRMPEIELLGCSDLDAAKAAAAADRHGLSARSIESILDDPAVEIVVNLTNPQAHVPLSRQVIAAGRSVYSEKPLGVARAEAAGLVEAAAAADVRIGCAPDTFLGAGLQTSRRLLDDGAIGTPIAATAFMAARPPELWHPDPGFLYQTGAGPLIDMGPYYITALVSLLGPVRRVTGMASTPFDERRIHTGRRAGQTFAVGTPTHVSAVLTMGDDTLVTLVTSFDIVAHQLPMLELYGSDGTLALPDPNYFGGPVRLSRDRREPWQDMVLTFDHEHNARGLGLADMASAMRAGRPHRAGADLAYHVLDVLLTIFESAESGRHLEVASTCARPEPMTPREVPASEPAAAP